MASIVKGSLSFRKLNCIALLQRVKIQFQFLELKENYLSYKDEVIFFSLYIMHTFTFSISIGVNRLME